MKLISNVYLNIFFLSLEQTSRVASLPVVPVWLRKMSKLGHIGWHMHPICIGVHEYNLDRQL